MNNSAATIRIIGIGSPHGDDAVAWAAIRRLRAAEAGRAGVTLHMVDGGQRLLDVLDGQGAVVLLDAVVSGARPGTVHRMEWPDARLESLSPGSTHTMRPAEALRLAAALGIAPPRVVVLGIEAGCWEPGTELTSETAAALPELVRRVREELDNLQACQTASSGEPSRA